MLTWILLFILCRKYYSLFSHPILYRRKFNNGKLLETADSYTELEAVDPKGESFEREEFKDARLRIHPFSRQKIVCKRII